MKTLRGSLLKALSLGGFLTLLLLSLFVNFAAREEINEILDSQIQQVAFTAGTEGTDPDILEAAERTVGNRFEEQPGFVIQIWTPEEEKVYGKNQEPPLPSKTSTPGFGWSADGNWRTFSYSSGDRWVQVSQSASERRLAALLVTLSLMGPILLFMVPALALVVIFSVKRGLRPLGNMAGILRDRSPYSLNPLPEEELPGEILPLVRELNGLLQRLSDALESKQMFLANAAHELRTPVTAVRLQVQLARRAAETEEKDAALSELEKGVLRISHLLDQLLTYARLDPGFEEEPFSPVPLGPLVREAITVLLPLSRERDIDLGLVRDDTLTIPGNRRHLLTLFLNLLDNAVRYTPSGGNVDVSLIREEGVTRLEIVDSGPGIPAEEREKVFERFYRGRQRSVTGSGLGLPIAREIAKKHGLSIALDEGTKGRGLKVTLTFPPG